MKKPYPAFAIFCVIFAISVCFSLFAGYIVLENKNKVAQITKDLTLKSIPTSLSEIKVSVLLSSMRQEFERSMFATDRSLRNESAYNAEKIHRSIQLSDDSTAKKIVSDVIELVENRGVFDQEITNSKWTLLDGAIQKHVAYIVDNSFDEITSKLVEVEAEVESDGFIFQWFTGFAIAFQTVVLIVIFKVFVGPISKIEKEIERSNVSEDARKHSNQVMHSHIKELYSLQRAINQLHLATLENEKMQREISAEMEKAKLFAEEKAEFLNSMSHEINTPLATLGILIHLTEQTDLNDKQKVYVARLAISVNYLRTLMERVLKMSRMDANRLELEIVPFDLNELVNEVFLILEPAASRKHIRFHTYVDKYVPDMVLGDRLNVKEILINFANNAIKFTSSGEVSIRVKIESINKNVANIKLLVVDSGCGIAADDLSLLFQRFSQLNKKSFAGTGLGLAITKGLAELMGGSVGVESSERVGSVFWAKIPFEFQKLSEHKALQSNEGKHIGRNNTIDPLRVNIDDKMMCLLGKIYIYARNDLPDATATWLENEAEIVDCLESDGVNIGDLLNKFKLQQAADYLSILLGEKTGKFDIIPALDSPRPLVLVIDDTPGNLELLSLLLKNFATVKVAVDPDRGIEIAQSCSNISLVILDVSMPFKSGYEVIKELKDNPATSGIPVVMISASESHDTRQRCMASGAAEFINRNKSADEVEALVRSYLSIGI